MKRAVTMLALCVLASSTQLRAEGPYGLTDRHPVGPFLNQQMPSLQPETGDWTTVNAFPNLVFPDPIGMVSHPRANLLYVYTRQGEIYSFANDPGVRDKRLFLRISAKTQGWDDCGLLGMAFHPEFGLSGSTNRGFVYVYYQYSENPTDGPERPPRRTPAYNRLSRFTLADGEQTVDPDSELVLINQYDRDLWHNGGAMFFHPDDGFLYLTLGDEGGIDAEYDNDQRIDHGLFSGVIRIDVDQNPETSHPIRRQPKDPLRRTQTYTANYFIPNDNPFVNPAGTVLEEFWCIGLRSPHRMTYDPETDSIWLGDVGPDRREEINLVEKGGNYEWAYREGRDLTGPRARPAQPMGKEISPLYDYPHANGDNCIIGGYVYRGREFADRLGGQYVFGDNGSGRIWALAQLEDGSVEVRYLCNMPPGAGYNGLSSFAVDAQGEIYMCQMGPSGRIHKLARPADTAPQPPEMLSETGAFSEVRPLTPAKGLIPYDVNSPLWSDGARKLRWMALPNNGPPYDSGEQIGFSVSNEWSFPKGTVFVKHFELGMDDTDPTVTKRLETRLLIRQSQGGVYGVTYKWRPDETDAELLEDAVTEELSITTARPGGVFSNHTDIGDPLPGSTRYDEEEDLYILQAGGTDIWGAADAFHFAYQQISGDFDVKAQVESLTRRSLYTKAGLMARESLTPGSRHLFALVFPDNAPRYNNQGGYEFDYRPVTGSPTEAVYPPFPQPKVNYPDTWLRLKRQGNQFTAYAGQDGMSWNRFAEMNLALPQTIYLGMAATAQNGEDITIARFRELAYNRAQTWYYPSRSDCLSCHTPAARHVLGVNTLQLNGLFRYPQSGRIDNQLRTWNHLELLNPALEGDEPERYPRIVAITNQTVSLEQRIRSYLAANCAQCHRPGGVRANFDARYETPLEFQGLINGAVNHSLGVTGARVVAPASLERSILYLRINQVGEDQMPPLARNRIDPEAVNAFGEWIAGLEPAATSVGLEGEYYNQMNFTELKLIRTGEVVNFDWGLEPPDPILRPDTFSVRWKGRVQPQFTEGYTFYTTSDDGVRLWVNGELLIDNWTDHAATEDQGSLYLEAGRKYDLRLEYYDNGFDAVIRLEWASPNQVREVIPPGRLFPPDDGRVTGSPAQFTRVEVLSTGEVRLHFKSEAPGHYEIQATTDFLEWRTLDSHHESAQLIEFTDPEAAELPHRFYRVVAE